MSWKRSGGHWRAASGSGLSLGSGDANEPGDLEDDGWYILIVGGLSECYSACLSIYLACLCCHTATDGSVVMRRRTCTRSSIYL